MRAATIISLNFKCAISNFDNARKCVVNFENGAFKIARAIKRVLDSETTSGFAIDHAQCARGIVVVSLQAIVRALCVHEGVDCSIELKECRDVDRQT